VLVRRKSDGHKKQDEQQIENGGVFLHGYCKW
jgi:hypothetical protein